MDLRTAQMVAEQPSGDLIASDDVTDRGHPISAQHGRLGPVYWLMLCPALLLLGVLFIVPIAGIVGRSFYTTQFTLGNYAQIFSSPVYLFVIALTFRVAAVVTLICIALGYPTAYLLANAGPKVRRVLMIFVVLPYFTSIVVRTYAWMILLGHDGVINQLLSALRAINQPLDLLYNELGVLVGMAYVLLPFMILSLYTVMVGIDRSLVRAGYSLGASRWSTFRRIFLPLSLPGLAGGSLLVFILALGFFVTPALLGGPENLMIAVLIEREVEINVNWPLASALATVLLATAIIVFAVYARIVNLDRLLERLT